MVIHHLEMVIHCFSCWAKGSQLGVSVMVVILQLETQCHSLRSMQQTASTEKQQLEESNRVLEEQLQHINLQLQQTHGYLWTTRAAVAREHMEELQ